MSFVEQDDVIALGEEVVKALWELIGYELADADPADHLRRRDGPLRLRQARPALRPRARRVHRLLRGHPVPGVPGPTYVGAVVMPGGASQPRKELDAWQDWAKQRGAKGLAYVLVQRGRHARRPGRQEPVRGRARRPGRPRRRHSPATACSSAPGRPSRPAPLLGAARIEIGRRCGLIDEDAWAFLWVRRRPAVRADGRGRRRRRRRRRGRRVDRGAPRVHLAQAGVPRHLRHRPRHRARLRLRHRLQRQRDRRRVDPYPPPRRAGAGLRADGHQARRRRRRSSASCSTRSASAPRRTAASPSAGTGSCRCWPGTESIREVIAFPKSGGGYDPLTDAPAPITAQQRKEAGVDAKPEPRPGRAGPDEAPARLRRARRGHSRTVCARSPERAPYRATGTAGGVVAPGGEQGAVELACG